MQFLSENAELQAVLQHYEEELTCYQKDTPIPNACKLQLASPPQHLFEEWNVKLGATNNSMHLNYINDLLVLFAKTFGLIPEALLLKKFTHKPFTVTWLVPTAICERISDNIPSNMKWLEEKKVVYMALGEHVIYQLKDGEVGHGN